MDEERTGPLQDAWAREVQRRHMQRTLRRNGVSATEQRQWLRRREGRRRVEDLAFDGARPNNDWRRFERTLRPEQRRFADFTRYGYAAGEVPEPVTGDLRSSLYESRMAIRTGGRPLVSRLSEAEFDALPESAASDCGVEECVMCLRELPATTKLKALPCGHAFHGACLKRWCCQHARSCPVCRADIPATPPREP